MGRRRSPVKQTNRHVQELVVVSGHFFTESSIFNMAKKKSVVKRKAKNTSKRFSTSKKRGYKGRGPSGKPKHSKVAKMIKLAKMRAKSKGKKVVSKTVSKKKRL